MSLFYLIIFCQAQGIFSNYLDVDANYRSPKVERNNIVNKGVWVRNYKDSDKTANFLFRGNAIDVDNIVQGDFNAFGDGSVPNSPFISSYVERTKRSLNSNALKRFRKSLKNANTIDENDSFVKSKVITKLKPTSVFNEYPYEIAILLHNKEALAEAKNYSTYVINEMVKNDSQTVIPLTETNDTKIDEIVSEVINKSNNASVPKRRMSNYETEDIKNIELIGELDNNTNMTKESGKTVERDVSTKEDKPWKQGVSDAHKYKVLGKNDQTPPNKVVRPVTERGLIKVLSMLTNTFKKIMKQHSEIKDIHKKLNTMNEDFLKNIEIISDKFQDFESKYANIVTINQKIGDLEERNEIKEQHFRNKEKELSRNLIDFEVQQKKFLTQQRQFYNIQKLMLAQNERINAKQNAIAKTQSEISHRQNNFARILKKAKQVYIDSQSRYNAPKYAAGYVKIDKTENSNETRDVTEMNVQISTNKPDDATESVKINIFSIPVPAKLQNQDRILLSEKDEQPVDDLVYKYYFNNTYIDSLMKNFLSGFINTGESSDDVNNVKNKRDEITEGTTILLPVNKPTTTTLRDIDEIAGKNLKRSRRWISKRKKSHKNRGKQSDKTDEERHQPTRNLLLEPEKSIPEEMIPTSKKEKKNLYKHEAFIIMATDFCKGIGQNTNAQVLNWCIEKALRRLQNIDTMIPTSQTTPQASSAETKKKVEKKYEELLLLKKSKNEKKEEIRKETEKSSTTESTTVTEQNAETSIKQITESEPTTLSTVTTMGPMSTIITTLDNFFPDNDRLESNLKKFDLKPDTEGNVYYEGSMHASDYIKDDPLGESRSDFLPGLDSNSRVDNLDTTNNQANRREFLKRTLYSRLRYESMLSKVKKL